MPKQLLDIPVVMENKQIPKTKMIKVHFYTHIVAKQQAKARKMNLQDYIGRLVLEDNEKLNKEAQKAEQKADK